MLHSYTLRCALVKYHVTTSVIICGIARQTYIYVCTVSELIKEIPHLLASIGIERPPRESETEAEREREREGMNGYAYEFTRVTTVM